MDNEQKLLRDADRAAKAEALLNDPLLVEAFQTIERELIERWRETVDPLARDAIWQAVQINSKYQRVLKKAIENGKVAKAELNKIASSAGMSRPISVAV